MKTVPALVLLLALLALPACGAAAPAAQSTPAATVSRPLLRTSAGDFVIASARFVDRVNGTQARAGERILLVILTRPGTVRLDPKSFSLEAFQHAIQDASQGEVHLAGSGGTYAVCTMAGWVGDSFEDFAIGFQLPTVDETYRLFWPGNEPIDILPVN